MILTHKIYQKKPTNLVKILILHVKDLQNDFCIFRETAKSFSKHQVKEVFLKGDAVGGNHVHSFAFRQSDLKKHYVLKEVNNFLRSENPDVVIAHRYRAIQILAKTSKDLPCIKIGVFHGLNNLSFFEKKFLRSSTPNFSFVCVSQAVKNYLVNNKIPTEKCHVIHNAIDIKKMKKGQYSREQARQKLDLHNEDFIFAMVSRMSSQKGYEYLLPAFREVCFCHPKIKLCIIGNGKKKIYHKVEKFINKHRLQQNIILKGYIPNAYKYMRAFDSLVLPSTSEGFGLVLLEAMCAEIRIIASNAGGIPEVLGHDASIFESKNAQALQNSMLEVLRDTKSNDSYKNLQKFCSEKHYAAYQNLVELLQKNTKE